ncbi:MAG: MlaD family protein [Acidobacteriota bacterium]
MSEARRSEVISGLFVTLALVVFALFAFKVGRFDLMGLFAGEAVEGQTFFSNVRTLQVGSKVRVGGREVGEVTGLELVEGPVDPTDGDSERLQRLINQVSFELVNPELRLDPATARVVIAQESLLAPHYLELDPGRWPAPTPPPLLFDAALEQPITIASQEGTGIEELMAQAGPAIDELRAVLRTLNHQVLTPENIAGVSRAINELDGTLAEGRQIAAALNRGLLADDNIEALDRSIHNLDAAIADGRTVAQRLDTLLDPTKDPRLDRLLTDVSAATHDLRQNLDQIAGDLRDLLRDADHMVGSTEAELAEASRRLQRALWQGEMALRKIRANPAVLLFGDDETDLEARDIDLTEIRLRGRARPYEQRDERDEKP